jgi:ATP-dependent DNA helicase RecG
MTKKVEYKGISKRARLLLSQEEDYDVEFKLSLGQLDTQDIVAFANSETGGTVLIGVEELKTSTGRQRGKVVGCPIGDRQKLSIINRAESCVPPVDIEIFVENSSRTPFYRVEIPSGSQKPYCTAGGIYKIRGDGRTKPLLPNRLLYMFIESESREFIERFREAAADLEVSLLDTKAKVIEEMRALLSTIESMEQRIESSLGHIFASAEKAEALSNDAMALSDATLDGVEQVFMKLEQLENYSLCDMSERINVLLNHFDIEDPIIKTARVWVEGQTETLHREGLGEEEILEKLTLQWEASRIRAAWADIWKWSTNRLAALEKQEGEEGS